MAEGAKKKKKRKRNKKRDHLIAKIIIARDILPQKIVKAALKKQKQLSSYKSLLKILVRAGKLEKDQAREILVEFKDKYASQIQSRGTKKAQGDNKKGKEHLHLTDLIQAIDDDLIEKAKVMPEAAPSLDLEGIVDTLDRELDHQELIGSINLDEDDGFNFEFEINDDGSEEDFEDFGALDFDDEPEVLHSDRLPQVQTPEDKEKSDRIEAAIKAKSERLMGAGDSPSKKPVSGDDETSSVSMDDLTREPAEKAPSTGPLVDIPLAPSETGEKITPASPVEEIGLAPSDSDHAIPVPPKKSKKKSTRQKKKSSRSKKVVKKKKSSRRAPAVNTADETEAMDMGNIGFIEDDEEKEKAVKREKERSARAAQQSQRREESKSENWWTELPAEQKAVIAVPVALVVLFILFQFLPGGEEIPKKKTPDDDGSKPKVSLGNTFGLDEDGGDEGGGNSTRRGGGLLDGGDTKVKINVDGGGENISNPGRLASKSPYIRRQINRVQKYIRRGKYDRARRLLTNAIQGTDKTDEKEDLKEFLALFDKIEKKNESEWRKKLPRLLQLLKQRHQWLSVKEKIDYLKPYLTKKNWSERAMAYVALSMIRHQEALEITLQGLDDKRDDVRAIVIKALRHQSKRWLGDSLDKKGLRKIASQYQKNDYLKQLARSFFSHLTSRRFNIYQQVELWVDRTDQYPDRRPGAKKKFDMSDYHQDEIDRGYEVYRRKNYNRTVISSYNYYDYLNKLRRDGLDLVILFDVTESMQPYIDDARNNVHVLSKMLKELIANFRIGLIAYRDEVVHVQSPSRDMVQFGKTLSILKAHGGGDGPEGVDKAMNRSRSLRWRRKAAKLMIVVGDAPPRLDDLETFYKLVKRAKDRGRVTSFLNVGREVQAFAKGAEISGGQYRMMSRRNSLVGYIVAVIFGKQFQESAQLFVKLYTEVIDEKKNQSKN